LPVKSGSSCVTSVFGSSPWLLRNLGFLAVHRGDLAEAESSFDQLSSASHRAAAWVAQGDLAERRGDDKRAATLYKRAAEILQDFRF